MLWVFMTVAAIGLFWFGYRNPYRRRWLLPRRTVSRLPATVAVDRQHQHLASGGRVGETAVAEVSVHLAKVLREGGGAQVERELRPGVGYAVQVRALTHVGTPEAGHVLERQLDRSITRDPVEQAWYWADIAAGLRQLGHAPALPAVLRCFDAAATLPAGTVLASEAVAFPNFPTTLQNLSSPLGQSATRAIVAVSRGCRHLTLDIATVFKAGFSDLLATLSETAPPLPDPDLTNAMAEVERIFRRTMHWARLVPKESRPLMERAGMQLFRTAGRRMNWLAKAPAQLMARFPIASNDEQVALLRCLYTFRTDVSSLFPLLPDHHVLWWKDAIRCLTWSRSPAMGYILAGHASRWMKSRRNCDRAAVLLSTLRGLPGKEPERVLLDAISCAEPTNRLAATSALGWWPPYDAAAVTTTLKALRVDRNEATRTAAVAALARLGERAALDQIQAELHAEESGIRVSAVLRVASEELSWFWPELHHLAESDQPETALAAVEASERLREQVLGICG